jgi:PLP dependent protein
VTDSRESCTDPVRARIEKVRQRIHSACLVSRRSPDEVRLIAVTKRVAIEKIREAAGCGLTDFGENYIQEAKAKIETYKNEPQWPQPTHWHMIGHIQANKAKFVSGLFEHVHSVDRWELLAQLDRIGKPLSVLFEINISGEEQKHGATVDGLKAMLDRIGDLNHLKPVGLMTVPPWSDNPEDSRPIFAALRVLQEQMNKDYGLAMKELSMGMSDDFEVAIEEGATMVRVGTAIFGERQ